MDHPRISRDQVVHVARLARLALDEEQIDQMTGDLAQILGYMERLNEIDTSHVEPTSQVGVEVLALREDVPAQGIDRQTVLAQAPKPEHDGFAVPGFMDD